MACWLSWSLLLVVFTSSTNLTGAEGATFTFVNSCGFTVWVTLQANGGIPLLVGGGFELTAGSKIAVTAPAAWGGRFWGRTGCNFDSSGKGACEIGDCGGLLNCCYCQAHLQVQDERAMSRPIVLDSHLSMSPLNITVYTVHFPSQ